jgi:tRNA-specific 2-thiouridylase
MVAAALGIPFHAVDLKVEFREIIQYFTREYSRGRTPNPCCVCNRDLKFDRLLRFAEELGAEGVATGHSARIEPVDGRPHVFRGVDQGKDQSYQLFCVAEENLAKTYLPLGGLQKSEVRRMAGAAGLRTAKKADSQEVCFIPSNDYRKLLEQEGVELHPGELVDTSGAVLGTHKGTEHFTIGQRRGHGIASVEPMYVVEIIPVTGRVVLGSMEESGFGAMVVEEPNWIGWEPPSADSFRCEVQWRHLGRTAACEVAVCGDVLEVRFDEAQVAVAAGQGAAFYEGDRLLGGGWIQSAARVGLTTTDAPVE